MSGSSVACQEASESHRPTGRKKLCIVTSEAKCWAIFYPPPPRSSHIQRIPFKQLARWPRMSRPSPPQPKVQSKAQSAAALLRQSVERECLRVVARHSVTIICN
ncbi:uncharacterized protein Dana_GF27632 [Drosophila ananassae]|uniref:Uncharacterized protein n=1 Tax=Drosophila ananassae TaxID=7217 RepID=A0A0P9AQ09_DROAN|nr:uncharacterized protein Dana_GF27632 [Drosophila ananassae]